jgi:hypothetical protein
MSKRDSDVEEFFGMTQAMEKGCDVWDLECQEFLQGVLI